ncbi:MAG TPA: hypothetical protein VFO86_01580, partial [Terriglobia bacterium]|nr:hypothetical protein [Terriglobia bacterium]
QSEIPILHTPNEGHTTAVSSISERPGSRWMTTKLAFISAGAAIAVIAAFLYFGSHTRPANSSIASGTLPSRLSNSEFWTMVTDFSEPGGYFHSDNFVSNEIAFQEIIPNLQRTVRQGGVYLGVGPEQNFTYIAALRPQMAFIIDVRRQNMIEQLLYKAFMEISPDRASFVSMLFARPQPAGLHSRTTVDDLFHAFDGSNPNSNLFEKNLALALDHLRKRGITLSFGDQASMRKVYDAFYQAGPNMTYTSYGYSQTLGRGMPSYSELMTATDESGMNWAYLATEEQFQIVRQFELDNLIVPIVGNFAGNKAIRTVGEYIRDHHAIVTAFYLSNVEQYLFQQNDDWARFYTNTSTLPTDFTSTFIRSTADRRGTFTGHGRVRWALKMLTSPIEDQIQAFRDGEIHTYSDVLTSPNTIN